MSDRTPAKVTLVGATAATEVLLIDSEFHLVARALHRLERTVPAGIYKARFQLGSEVTDQPFEVAPGKDATVRGPPQVTLSAAPLPLTRLGTGRAPSTDELRETWEADGGETLRVILRDWSRRDDQLSIEVRTASGRRVDGVEWSSRRGARIGSARVRSGLYVLAATAGGQTLCRGVAVATGMRTVVSLPPGPALGSLEQSSVLMDKRPRPEREGSGPLVALRSARPVTLSPELLVQDMAGQALTRQQRSLLEPEELVRLPRVSPWALLLSAHGLLAARRVRMAHPLDPLDLAEDVLGALGHAYRKLERLLGWTADVAVLGLLTRARTEPVNLDHPPLLASTWRTLVALSEEDARAVTGGKAALRIADGLVPSTGWLIWSERAQAANERAGRLRRGARALLEPTLRPTSERVPSWVQVPELDQLLRTHAGLVARGLELPRPLAFQLAQELESERLGLLRSRALRRIAALRKPGVRVCLIVRPGRLTDERDTTFEDQVEDAAAELGMAAVQAPPVVASSAEMHEALSHADVVVTDRPSEDIASHRWASGADVERLIVFHGPEGHRNLVERLTRAVIGAPEPAHSQDRRRWLGSVSRAESRILALRRLMTQRSAETSARVLLTFSSRPFHREAPSVQREAFLIFRACSDWRNMLWAANEMSPGLRQTALVREQLALALKWSGVRELRDESIRILESLIEEIGPNGETCGILGGVYKVLWREEQRPGLGARWLKEAIRWYRTGAESSPEDPYPQVNLLTLLAVQGTPKALEERARLLPVTEKVVLERLFRRPSFWDLATMMEIAANKQQPHACREYLRLALGAPHEPWQRKTAAENLRILRNVAARGFEGMAEWLGSIVNALQ